MVKKKQKKEALSVGRLINEVLVDQLGIPFHNIVNDSTFSSFTGSKRPDIMISNVEYTGENDTEYIQNLLCYVEAKDTTCNVDDSEWQDAFNQGLDKAPKLEIPFFGVTNCRTTYFYNVKNGERLKLNGNLISEFQTLDVFRIIRKKLKEDSSLTNVKMGVDSLSSVSEAVFNKKLWELKEEFREIDFANNTQKIDFTIGLIALEYYEEKADIDGTKDLSLQYWSHGKQYISNEEDIAKANNLKTLVVSYINRLISDDSDFKEFSQLLITVKNLIDGQNAIVSPLQLQSIYPIIDSMKPMHGTGFDLFGAVYENFANSKEKKDFGEYFTRRHYAHVLAELLLKDEDLFREIKIIDPSCGTGGMLTESFKVLKTNYEDSGTYKEDAQEYLSKNCFYGIDIRSENISRTRLNMFLVGDGHTNMFADNSLKPEKPKGIQYLEDGQYDYVITNPPYGAGTILAATDVLNSYRMEVAFLYKVIDLLKIKGKACVITPDGVLENPSFKKLREELMMVCKIEAIVSLPRFAFAPYTKEKTYALFLQKKHKRNYNATNKSFDSASRSTGKFQSEPIWMYIIDNDGFANSDKRFPTRLRGENQQWLHDEVSGYSDNDGLEKKSILVQRWKVCDDTATGGTIWMTDKGQKVKLRKCGFVHFETIKQDPYYTMLPEKYLRPYEQRFIDGREFVTELEQIEQELSLIQSTHINVDLNESSFEYKKYQIRNIRVEDCIGYESGHSGLTEEFIYSTLLLPGERYKVKSSSTSDDTLIGYVPQCNLNGSLIKINNRPETLLIARNGTYVGQTEYIVNEKYTINDHAYILYVKDDCPYKINLKWFSIQYRSEIMNYTSSSANGTWNMTGFFKNVIIDIPDFDEQLKIVRLYEKAENMKNKISSLSAKLSSLLKKEIC
ncbi:MAG: N-6 DNA methylase [Bacteroidaceae bacterium]|nr:N-6 DNA methylase [Bacteroidaceae bacterium]